MIFLALLGAPYIYIYDISSLRVNSQFAAWWAVNDTDVDRSTIEEKKKPCFFWLY